MKIGLMNNPAASVYDEITFMGETGYEFVDLTIEGPNAWSPDTQKVRALLDRYKLFIVGHTDPCLPYAYPIESIRKACFNELRRCAGIFSSLGATIMNIHPCYYCPPVMKEDLVRLNVQALKPLAEMAGSHGLTLILENFKAPFDSVATYSRLLEEVPGLQIHLDFGHANLGKDDATSFCTQLGEHIRHVHFSDNHGQEDEHMPLGMGNIDWEKAVSALKSIGYDETITIEVFVNDRSAPPQPLEASRRLVLDLWG
jgi:sugar phosphate isomerase/epimerase